MARRPDLHLLLAGILAATSCQASAQASCPPAEWSLATLRALAAKQWKLAEDAQRQSVALALLPCLGDPDPALRDEIAFEGLSHWLRAKQLTTETQLQILQSQLKVLDATQADAQGFAKPFAALALSEVARADRVQPFLSPTQRAALVDAGARYLQGLSDYRGFTDGQGWRHGVAHGADLMLQLALNPAIDAAQLERVVRAVQSQVVPGAAHFYIYGEPDRLVRPIIYAANRGLLAQAFWSDWLQALASPAPLPSWDQAFQTEIGLARLHNTKAFLRALDAALRLHDDTALNTTFAIGLASALKQLP